MVPVHHATIEKGKLVFRNRERFMQWLSGLRGPVEVIVRQRRNKRSDKQNRYYWAYLELISEETGNLPADLHELFKRMLLTPEVKTILGREVKLPRSTTTLDALQFTEYVTKIEAMTGVPAPNPDDFYSV